MELAVLQRIDKFPYTYNGRNFVNTLAAGNEDMRDSLDEFEFGKFATELRPLIDGRL